MEIFDSFANILSLLFGGSLISVVTWRFARRKADAEAKKAEAEAKQAEAEAAETKQDYYQQMMEDISKDRDYYKGERDELRTTIKKYDERIDELERKVARNGRMVDGLRPFICTDLGCKLRQRGVISPEGGVSKEQNRKSRQTREEKDIEPLEMKDM